jgi:hypothetical protein
LVVLAYCAQTSFEKSEVQPTSIEDIIRETKVGYIKRASEIEINATPSDIVVVMLGGSGGPDGDNPLGGSTILSTKLSIDASEKTSTTAAAAAVISDTALADDAEITIDIDQIGSSTAGKGLKIWLIGYR